MHGNLLVVLASFDIDSEAGLGYIAGLVIFHVGHGRETSTTLGERSENPEDWQNVE
jgi:hypothetical protein